MTAKAVARMPARCSRRRALKIVGSVLALPAGATALQWTAAQPAPVTWQGEALGAQASLSLWHPNTAFARRAVARLRGEIVRLERIFSLYRADSEISRLNIDGRLARPARELVTVAEQAWRIAELSGGAFDPTVQPLWNVFAAAASKTVAGPPDYAAIEEARSRTGYRALDVSPSVIGLERARMELTLNGIAQGYITDRIADLVRDEGFESAMVELGETRAVGVAPDGEPFRVALVNPLATWRTDRLVELTDEALSVSGGYGFRFGDTAEHHIFDPATGHSADKLLDATVVAPRAMIADGLSTAIFVAGERDAPALLAPFPRTRAMVTRQDGSVATIS